MPRNHPHPEDEEQCEYLEIQILNKNKDTRDPDIPTFYVGRPGPLGNPWSHMKNTLAKYKVATRDESIDRYEEWIRKEMYRPGNKVYPLIGEMVMHFMPGCTIALECWCAPLRCHAEVIRQIVLEDDWLYK